MTQFYSTHAPGHLGRGFSVSQPTERPMVKSRNPDPEPMSTAHVDQFGSRFSTRLNNHPGVDFRRVGPDERISEVWRLDVNLPEYSEVLIIDLVDPDGMTTQEMEVTVWVDETRLVNVHVADEANVAPAKVADMVVESLTHLADLFAPGVPLTPKE